MLVDRHQIMQILVNLDLQRETRARGRRAARSRSCWSPSRESKAAYASRCGTTAPASTPENLPKIFSHGFTTKKTGHGFGLHNCANAAQQMDGSLTAYSDGPGKGASFVLRMPVEFVEDVPQRVGFAEAGGDA